MIDNARYLTKFVKERRVAELFEVDGGYIIRLIKDSVIIEDRVVKGKSMYFIVDTCENWCEGIIDPWV